MDKQYFFSTLLALAILSCMCCKDKAAPATDISEYISSELPSDFLNFHQKFHSDSMYQIAHVIFPLKEKNDQTLWQKEEWLMHKPFDDLGGEYKRKFTNLNGIIIENIADARGFFKMERRFIKSSDGYNLIYYHYTNAFEGSEDWEAG